MSSLVTSPNRQLYLLSIPEMTPVGQTRGSPQSEFIGLLAVSTQLVLIAMIMRNAQLESHAFHRILYIATGGFVVNHVLPFRFRLPFFLLLSIACLVLVLGGSNQPGLPSLFLGLLRASVVLVYGSVLISICHIPVGYWKRVGLLVGAGAILFLLRANIWTSNALDAVWPVIAAMFMFRLVVYLYDVSHTPKTHTAARAYSYFFLIPNVSTLLFPVIDFRTFAQNYYDDDAFVIYQRGAKWMARGVLHLILYRLVDRLWALDPANVADGTDLIQFLICNIFLYLKVSGLFHLCIGMLLLFGFNLPETNHRYFLASSFSDYWRRVNIYWRSFIMKVFYYPAFFFCKDLGQTKALILATLWSFFVTWALHIYQTWWIRRKITFTWPDALFWLCLAGLVLANSLFELKRSRKRRLSNARFTVKESIGLAMRTAATFSTICILWSLWSSPTIAIWIRMWSLADRHTFAWGGLIFMCVMLATVLFEVLPGHSRGPSKLPVADTFARRFGFDSALSCFVLVAIALITNLRVQTWLDTSALRPEGEVSATLHLLREVEGGDGVGYYGALTKEDDGNRQFLEMVDPATNQLYPTALREVKDARFRELVPNAHLESNGLRFDVNSWGMRDREYDQAKPLGTTRIALLGSSQVNGYGLVEKEMFKTTLEDRLNREHQKTGRFEIMNFSIAAQSPLGQLWFLQNRVSVFHPDVALLVTHLVDYSRMGKDVVRSVRQHIPLPPDFPKQILLNSAVTARTPMPYALLHIHPYEPELISFGYRDFVHESRLIDAVPVCVFLPVPDDLPLDAAKASDLLKRAKDAGFIVINLSQIYDGVNPTDLTLNEPMHHSNAKANAIIAIALYDRLTSDPQIALLNIARKNSNGRSVE